ncbi:MAG TPA: DUF5985 family protein [Stellaceae bacterium]|nr:DUF5985 family protein [Stellaceae bacterium]
MVLPSAVYLLCFFTSGLCAYLLSAAFRRRRERLLLWSALCFWLIAAENLLVFIDIILLPGVSLLSLRLALSLAAVCVLLFGFVWEIE